MREEEGFDVYPIVHGGKVYHLITPLDLTFAEVHLLLDWLQERNAFSPTCEEERVGPESLFSCPLPEATYDVDVQGHEVVVFRRTPA